MVTWHSQLPVVPVLGYTEVNRDARAWYILCSILQVYTVPGARKTRLSYTADTFERVRQVLYTSWNVVHRVYEWGRVCRPFFFSHSLQSEGIGACSANRDRLIHVCVSREALTGMSDLRCPHALALSVCLSLRPWRCIAEYLIGRMRALARSSHTHPRGVRLTRAAPAYRGSL